jgi:hypothetical protein
MSRMRLNIDRLVLRGFEQLDGKALAEALQSQLSDVLCDRATRSDWARSHRTPLLKLGRMPLETGTVGARKFGKQLARAVGKRLKP